jgi:erythromycin esterase-like protein
MAGTTSGPGRGGAGRPRERVGAPDPPLHEVIAEAAEPLPPPEHEAFAAAFDRFADRRIVLLGEASHGTAEFYRTRAAITRRFVERHGHTIVAVEADWPDAAAVDRYVRGRPHVADTEAPFQRFPTWMWRNVEMLALIDWLREHDAGIPDAARRAGFYGLDLYNMRASIAAVLDYLGGVDPEAASIARRRYGCLAPWEHEPAGYGAVTLSRGYAACEQGVLQQCHDLLRKRLEYCSGDPDGFLDAAQNARLVASAERYYRTMYYGGAESWNLRDTHMYETLVHLLQARGPQAKALVWAHNSHVGDARHTDMGRERGELNLGQLVREKYGDQAALIGFGTHTGTVAAAHDWGDEMRVMRVRPSLEGSIERASHDAGVARFLLDFGADASAAARERLLQPLLQRFIGVIYRPATELASHYAQADVAAQYDAWVWFDETSAVVPLGREHARDEVPDTFPFAL